MTRVPDLPCAACGAMMWRGNGSLPAGEATCRPCRTARSTSHGYLGYRQGCRCDVCRNAKSEIEREYRARRAAEGRPVGPSAEARARAYAKEKANYRYDEQKRRRDAVRRARKAGATVEHFTNETVFERDGWMCGICGTATDRSAVYPDPAMPSLDHINPLSLGGDHSIENTRCAHLGCNVRRGNRVA